VPILSQSCSSGRLFFPVGVNSCSPAAIHRVYCSFRVALNDRFMHVFKKLFFYFRIFCPQKAPRVPLLFSGISSYLSFLIQLSGTSYFRPAARFPIYSTSRSILSFSLTVKDHKHMPVVHIFIEHVNVDVTNERTFALCGSPASLGAWEEK
jgi:hypothetical protein